jgi:hypothetical protein
MKKKPATGKGQLATGNGQQGATTSPVRKHGEGSGFEVPGSNLPDVNLPPEEAVADPPAAKPGLTCTRCGSGHFEVISTRRSWGGRIIRRRECRYCGRRITTVEEEPPAAGGTANLET